MTIDTQELTSMKEGKYLGKIITNAWDAVPKIINWLRSGWIAYGKTSDVIEE